MKSRDCMTTRRARFGAGLAALLAGAAALGASADARTMKRMSLEELVDASDAVVLATAGGMSTQTVDGGVVTFTEFTVDGAAFGAAGGTIVVETPGGAIQGALIPVAEVESGVPMFFEGRQSLLFLDGAPNGDFTLVDPLQGAAEIEAGSEGANVRLADGARMAPGQALQAIAEIKARGRAKRLAD